MTSTETYRLQYIRCGKAGCTTCPHGPYWYAFWKDEGKTRSRYVGKQDPRDPVGKGAYRASRDAAAHKKNPWSGILNSRTASLSLACTILECTEDSSQEYVERSYRRLCRKHHPDRGGDHDSMICVEAAWSYLKARMKWK